MLVARLRLYGASGEQELQTGVRLPTTEQGRCAWCRKVTRWRTAGPNTVEDWICNDECERALTVEVVERAMQAKANVDRKQGGPPC